MPTLHIVSHSPFADQRLASCLRALGPADALLLCGDAVLALQCGSEPGLALSELPNSVAVHALEEDLVARGINPAERVFVADYAAFVELTCRFDKVNTWL
jgi:tRNA 2-thiouridine synthesizing protein B